MLDLAPFEKALNTSCATSFPALLEMEWGFTSSPICLTEVQANKSSIGADNFYRTPKQSIIFPASLSCWLKY